MKSNKWSELERILAKSLSKLIIGIVVGIIEITIHIFVTFGWSLIYLLVLTASIFEKFKNFITTKGLG